MRHPVDIRVVLNIHQRELAGGSRCIRLGGCQGGESVGDLAFQFFGFAAECLAEVLHCPACEEQAVERLLSAEEVKADVAADLLVAKGADDADLAGAGCVQAAAGDPVDIRYLHDPDIALHFYAAP